MTCRLFDKQCGYGGPVFADQYVECPARGARFHDFNRDARAQELREHGYRQEALRFTRAEQQDFRLQFESRRKIGYAQVFQRRRIPVRYYRIPGNNNVRAKGCICQAYLARGVGAHNIALHGIGGQFHPDSMA